MDDTLYATLQNLAEQGYGYLDIIDACNELLDADTTTMDHVRRADAARSEAAPRLHAQLATDVPD